MIKTIIFDFGDVFVNLDKPATLREMRKLRIEAFSEKIEQLNMDLEKGLVDSAAFVQAYCEEYQQLEKDQLLNSWNAILVDFPRYRFEFLKKLSREKKYRLILLSNTNEIHIDWIREHVPFFEAFRSCFDAFYLSHEINFRKPDAAIFRYVLEQHRLKPQQCLFIDDTTENTEAAEALGMHTWNLEPTREDVIDLFTAKKDLF